MSDTVIWVSEWLQKNNGQPYQGQNSTSQAIMLRNAKAQFKENKTYENAVDVQKYTRQLKDHMTESLKGIKQ